MSVFFYDKEYDLLMTLEKKHCAPWLRSHDYKHEDEEVRKWMKGWNNDAGANLKVSNVPQKLAVELSPSSFHFQAADDIKFRGSVV